MKQTFTRSSERKAIVVDDVRSSRQHGSLLLSRLGYSVCAASNGLEAFKLFELSAASLILTDFEMPIWDGLRLVNAIRMICDAPLHAPVIIVNSASVDDSIKRRSLAAGANGFIQKPLSFHELQRTLHDSFGSVAYGG